MAALVQGLGCSAQRVHEVEEMPPGIVFEDLEFRSYRGPWLVASGHAERASFRRDSTDLVAQHIRVRFPARPGVPDDLLTAARGTGNLRAGKARLEGGTVFTVRGGGRRH